MKNSPWIYKPIEELLASVRSDLNIFDDAGLIDETRCYKIIAQCNEKLGEKLHKSKECLISIENYRAPIPNDLWKIENVIGVKDVEHSAPPNLIPGRHLDFSNNTPDKECNHRIQSACLKEDRECMYVTTTPSKEVIVHTQKLFPLHLSDKLINRCEPYCPSTNWHNSLYEVDIEGEEFIFSFKTGKVYICYLGDLQDEDGSLLYPFHPLLNSYYEYAIKEKILEDMFLNSDADVVEKLKYIKEERRKAYYDAYNYIQSSSVNDWSNVMKKRKMEFYKKYYKMFE